MRFEETAIAGVVIARGEPRRDARGAFERVFCPVEFAEAGHPFQPAQTSLSRNPNRHTLRGLHWQDPPHAEAKLVRCVRGRIFDVAVDLRRESETFRRWIGVELAAEGDAALLVPEGCAHGFLTLEPETDVLYMIDRMHVPGVGRGARFDDPAFAIDWPAAPAVIGEADLSWPAHG